MTHKQRTEHQREQYITFNWQWKWFTTIYTLMKPRIHRMTLRWQKYFAERFGEFETGTKFEGFQWLYFFIEWIYYFMNINIFVYFFQLFLERFFFFSKLMRKFLLPMVLMKRKIARLKMRDFRYFSSRSSGVDLLREFLILSSHSRGLT